MKSFNMQVSCQLLVFLFFVALCKGQELPEDYEDNEDLADEDYPVSRKSVDFIFDVIGTMNKGLKYIVTGQQAKDEGQKIKIRNNYDGYNVVEGNEMDYSTPYRRIFAILPGAIEAVSKGINRIFDGSSYKEENDSPDIDISNDYGKYSVVKDNKLNRVFNQIQNDYDAKYVYVKMDGKTYKVRDDPRSGNKYIEQIRSAQNGYYKQPMRSQYQPEPNIKKIGNNVVLTLS